MEPSGVYRIKSMFPKGLTIAEITHAGEDPSNPQV